MNSGLSRKIQWLSLILAICVIFIHTYNSAVYGLTQYSGKIAFFVERFEFYSNTAFNALCVPFFFMLSGYLFFRNYNWDKIFKKYKSRFFSLVLPYVLWCSLYFVAYAILTHTPFISVRMNMEPVELSVTYYLDCLWNSTYTVLGFVKNLIIAILGAPVWFLLFQKKNKKWLDILSVIGSCLLISYAYCLDIGYLQNPLPIPLFNLHFLLGGFFSIRCTNFAESNAKLKTLLSVIGFTLGIVYLFIASGKISCLWTISMIIFIWFLADVFPYSKELYWWQKQTFFIYCAHSIVLEMLEKLWLLVAGKSVGAALADYLLMPFIVLAILSVTAHILNRYCKPAYKLLTGNRN